ncbi:hypothetical protein [Ignavigranum ruoffiae]|uniref:hypothetical protein n=1 Tax=Ignavigranum ruoffiae TaxID=89093 RepID=UPI0023572589|nr:hypothetical protein [Ignavigranum ruoffiae]
MADIANLDTIKWLFNNKSGYKIAKDTGIAQSTISRFQTGETKLENMRFSHAIKLTNYAENIKKRAQPIKKAVLPFLCNNHFAKSLRSDWQIHQIN